MSVEYWTMPEKDNVLLNDRDIISLCESEKPMISPFAPTKVREVKGKKVVSYGASEFGYDVRLGTQFKVLTEDWLSTLDPKSKNSEAAWKEFESEHPVLIPANSIMLVNTLEVFNMPDDVAGWVFDKSTYSRLGLSVPHAVLEPGWTGVPTIRLANLSRRPIRLYPNEGLAQVVFVRGKKPQSGYGDGKYQGQTGVTLPTV